jgi:hypothetical protein
VTVKEGRQGDPFPARVRVRNVAREMFSPFTDTRLALVAPDGTFVLKQVFMGDYGIRADGLPARYYLDSSAWPSGGHVQITLGADGGVVTGRVLTAGGAAVPDASVVLALKDSDQLLTTHSDQTGAYRFTSGVRSGEYRLSIAGGTGMELKLGPRESRTVDLKTGAGQ